MVELVLSLDLETIIILMGYSMAMKRNYSFRVVRVLGGHVAVFFARQLTCGLQNMQVCLYLGMNMNLNY